MASRFGANDRQRSRVGGAIALLAVVLLAGACSDDGSDAGRSDDAAAAATIDELEFTGTVDEFYQVPDPLPDGEDGALIRTMPVEAPPGEVGLRIMYHSTDADGDDRAVTGLVYHPTGEAPDGGWPILAWAHGTSGLAARCAPSRNPNPPPDFGVRGIRVATDYLGLGPVGELHPYLSAAAEGHAVIDGVAAVRGAPELHASDDWVVVGVSQGGHAALVTNEAAEERMPDANLLGAVAIAPGSQLGETYGDDLQARVITTLVLVGVTAEDPDVELGVYLNPTAAAAATVIVEGCINDITAKMAGVALAPDYFTTDPRTAEVGREWLEENDPGQVASNSPLLVVQGGKDLLVLPPRTAALIERLCGLGQVVERLDVPTGDHDTVTEHGRAQVSTWVAARFAGTPPTDHC